MNYQQQIKHPNWQKKRLEILKRDKWMCKMCYDKESTLHVHHKKYEKGKLAWEYPNSNFVTLCECCHEIVTEHSKKYTNYDFNNVKYHISDNWEDGSVIVFAQINDILSMKIYDKNKKSIIGFRISGYTLINIQPLVNKAIKIWGQTPI